MGYLSYIYDYRFLEILVKLIINLFVVYILHIYPPLFFSSRVKKMLQVFNFKIRKHGAAAFSSGHVTLKKTTTCDRCKSTVSTEARMAAHEAQALKTKKLMVLVK